jgi:hypothetical protein
VSYAFAAVLAASLFSWLLWLNVVFRKRAAEFRAKLSPEALKQLEDDEAAWSQTYSM